MKRLIALLVCAAFATGAAFAQAPVATPAHKKAAPSAKHKKVTVKIDRSKKS